MSVAASSGSRSSSAGWWWSAACGLLASSCCLLQLALNALALPCAGFSLLTPYRPFFLALTIVSLGRFLWQTPANGRFKWRLAWVAFILLLTASPELVGYWNRGIHMHQLAHPWAASTPATTASTSHRQLLLHVKGIRCEACANRIKTVLGALPEIQRVQVNQRTGQVLISLPEQASLDEQLQDLLISSVEQLDDNYSVQLRGLSQQPVLFVEDA